METNSNSEQIVVGNALLAEQAASQTEGKYLTFLTDGQLFGVPIADVVQIVGIQTITEIPDFPSYAKGIINLRGSVIPLIDVRLRFGKEELAYSERTCIIVTSIQGMDIGFIVDGVDAVTDIEEEQISPPPKLAGDQANAFLTGVATVDDGVVLLLCTTKLLSEGALGILSRGQA